MEEPLYFRELAIHLAREGFWGILKTEMYYLYHFGDYEALREAVCAYIDFYNNRRYQKKLGCMTPAEFIAASAK